MGTWEVKQASSGVILQSRWWVTFFKLFGVFEDFCNEIFWEKVDLEN